MPTSHARGSLLIAIGLATGSIAFADSAAPAAKNVILLIGDGAGFNTWAAASLFQGTAGAEFYDGPGWVRLAASVHPLRTAAEPPVSRESGTVQVPSFVYDPLKAWDPTPVSGGPERYPWFFAGYKWLRDTQPDSANTATAILTGQKTYNGGVNVDGRGEPITRTVASLAHKSGRRVGIVTDVPLPHATPAVASGAHHADRDAYCAIAIEMLTDAALHVIVGAGNPDYDNNGLPIDDAARKDYRYVGGPGTWGMLTGRGELNPGDRPCEDPALAGSSTNAGMHGAADVAAADAIVLDQDQVDALERWTLVQTREEIAAVAKDRPPQNLLVVPTVGPVFLPLGRATDTGEPDRVEVGATLQQQRGSRADPRYTPPGYDPPISGVPTLAELSRLALVALGSDDSGFFLMIEGGAIDWAMHDNQMGRMIEETIALKDAVRAVTDWIEGHDAWDETLVIVTSDHDHLLWGPASDTIPFQPLVDNGPGEMPSYRWLSDGHSNSLVPLFARGVGADALAGLARREDPFRGRYLDQTDVFRVLEGALAGAGDQSQASGEASMPGSRVPSCAAPPES